MMGLVSLCQVRKCKRFRSEAKLSFSKVTMDVDCVSK